MRSLSKGESPVVPVRVTAVRKAQLKYIADLHGMKVSELLREAIDGIVAEQDESVRPHLIRIAMEHTQQ